MVKRTSVACLSGLMAGLVFMAPLPSGQAEETAPADHSSPPVQVAESLLNQEPKPRPVMRHREEIPASTVAPARAPQAASQGVDGTQTRKLKKAKKKKLKTTAGATAMSKPSPQAKPSIKASGKTKNKPSVKTKKAPAKSVKRKSN